MNIFNILKFIGEKSPNYTLEDIKNILDNFPVEGKGYIDDNGKQGEWEKTYGDQLKYKINFKDDKRNGEYIEYWDNGQLHFKGNYKDNKRDGYWEIYYLDGSLKSKGNYKDDKMDGYYEEYHKNGQLSSKGNYNNNKIDGVWERYYDNGQLSYRENYEDGELQKREYYDKDGERINFKNEHL